MSSKTIEWHEECLQNTFDYLDRMNEEILALYSKYEKAMNDAMYYQKQINRAKKLGKKKFDSNIFKAE